MIRGFAAVLATGAVIIGLLGLGTSVSDQTAVLRSLLAATAGVIALAFLLSADRRALARTVRTRVGDDQPAAPIGSAGPPA